MRMSVVGFFMILTTVFLSGCGQDGMASLDNRAPNYYGRSGVMAANQTIQAAPVMSISSNDLGASTTAPQTTATANRTISTNATSAPFARASATWPPTNASSPVTQAITVASGNWQWPVNGKITQRFGVQGNGVSNEGIVIAAAEGTPIRAAQAGEVAYVGNDTKNYGNIVILRHTGGEMTSYAHAKTIAVKQGDKVQGGSVIAYVGQSGNAKAPELHFAVRDGKTSVDPLTKLPSQPQQMASN